MPSQYADQFPDVVEIVVEIPRGSRNKYEFDEEAQRLPPRPRPVVGGLLQLRLRVHRGHARRRRRPHRRAADHRRAHVHGLPRLGPADRRAGDARRDGLRLQDAVRRDRRPAPAAHRAPRAGPPAPPRRDRALLHDLQAAREQGGRRRRAGASATRRCACSTRTASGTRPSTVPEGDAPAVRRGAAAGRRRSRRARPLIDRGPGAGPLGRVPRWVHVPNLHLTVRFLGRDRRRRPCPSRSRRSRASRSRAPWRSTSCSRARARSRPGAARARCGSASSDGAERAGRARQGRRRRASSAAGLAARRPRRTARTSRSPGSTRRRGADGAAVAEALRAAAGALAHALPSPSGSSCTRATSAGAAALRAPAHRRRSRSPARAAALSGPDARATLRVPTDCPARRSRSAWQPSFPAGPSSCSTRTGSRGPGTTSRPTCRWRRRRRSIPGPASRSGRATSRRCSRWS